MKKYIHATICAIFLAAIVLFVLPTKAFAAVDLMVDYSGVYQRGCNTATSTDYIDVPEIQYPGLGDDRGIIFITWRASSGGISPDIDGVFPSTSIERIGPSPSSINSASWVTTDTGYKTIYFNGTFDEAIVCAVTVNGIADLTAFTAENYDYQFSYTESTPTPDKQVIIFSSSIMGTENPNTTTQSDTQLLEYGFQTNITADTLSVVTALSDRQDYDTIGLDYNFNNGDNTDYANIIYEVEYPLNFITGTPVVAGSDFSFTGVMDASSYVSGGTVISSLNYSLDGPYSVQNAITPDDGVMDENIEELTLEFLALPDGNYTLTIMPELDYGGEYILTSHYVYEFEIGAAPPANDPTITINSGPVSNSYINLEFTADDQDGDIITRVYYTWEGGSEVDLTPVDGTYDESNEDFVLELGPYANGDYDLVLGVENDNAESHEELLNININNTQPPAVCVLSNAASPTSDNTPTHTIECASDDGVLSMERRYYHIVLGEVSGWTAIPSLTIGNYGDNSVTAEITPDAPLSDGNLTLQVRAYTGTGRVQDGPNVPIDAFTVEAIDDTAPVAKLNPILPNPVVDNTPFITGACIDNHSFDTNSMIANMYYRIDGASWTALTALDGSIDSSSERFSIELSTLGLGAHTVDLRCVDTEGNDTNVQTTNAARSFTVQAPSAVPADEVTITGSFDNQDFADLIDSNLVWGNGIVRLRETISASQTTINDSGYEPRYSEPAATTYEAIVDGQGRLWHAQLTALSVYDPNTTITTTYDHASLDHEIYDLDIFSSGGKEYALIVSGGVYVYNLTDDTYTSVNVPGLDVFAYNTRQIVRDSRGGRLAYYAHTGSPNGSANIYYWDLNNTPENFADDTFEWLVSTGAGDIGDVNYIVSDLEDANTLYMASYNVGIVKYDDKNTPLDNSDDEMMQLDNSDLAGGDITLTSQIAFDPTTKVVYAASANSSGSQLFAWDAGATPFDDSDDVAVMIADEIDLFKQVVYNVRYLPGPQYIGGQVIMTTYRGDLIYYNTNGSPSDSNDDTAYLLPIANGLFPEMIGGINVVDYNTMYVNFQRQGFKRINLDRGWATPGNATTIELPPEDRLIVNNITLTNIENLGSIDTNGAAMSNPSLSGVNPSASIDGGVTYESLPLNQLLFIDQTDYRIRLNLNLTQLIGERTPVLGAFTVKYAAYEDEEQSVDPTLDIEIPVTSFAVNDPFTMELEVQDPLGYVIPSYNGTVDLTLQLFNEGVPAPYLNYVSAPLVAGVASITDATINTPGEYRVLASNIQLSANSQKLTVVAPTNNVTPTMSFYSNKYVIDPGESVTLYWTTTGLDTVSLSTVGNVAVSGNRVISPTQSTYYILSGTNSESDSLSAGLQIIVRGTGNAGDTENPEDEEEFTNGEIAPLTLTVTPEEARVYPGGRVDISWVTGGDADDVFIDYTNTTGSPTGNLQVYPEKDMVITITARRGTDSISKQIRIFIVQPDAAAGGNTGAAVPVSPVVPVTVGILSIFTLAAINGGIVNYAAIFFGFVIWRKRKYWGLVFDAVTFKPLALVTVRIYKKGLTTRTFVAQTVTDLEGKYGINVAEPGSYTVEFIREGYANVIKEITVLKGEDVVLDAGMRGAQNPDSGLLSGIRYFWKQNAAAIMQLARIALVIVMIWGLSITIAVIGLTPSLVNYLVAALYIVVILAQVWVLLEPFFGRKSAALVDADNKRPVLGAILRLVNVSAAAKVVENVGISNSAGIVKIRAERGSYQYMASKSGYATNSGSTFIDESGKLAKPVLLQKEAPSEAGAAAKFGTV